MSDFTGQSLGRYHILEKLGEGGMAVVYKAYDTHLECEVAVKVIRLDNLPRNAEERTIKRFEREAKEVAKLSHPNIVRVTDYGEHNGIPFLVMPYLHGGTLKQILGKPIPWKQAISLIEPISRALDYAHKHKMIHRDVKPSNILITDSGDVMLTDFGIVKILDVEEGNTLTGTGVGLGTPEYMAPEQWIGQFSPAVDQYALGVVFYELVTGHKPYSADTPAAVLLKQANEPLPRPVSFVLDLPESVERFIFKVLAKRPEDRYRDMEEFSLALKNLQGSLPEENIKSESAVFTRESLDSVNNTMSTTDDLPASLERLDPGPKQVAQKETAPARFPTTSSKNESYFPRKLIGIILAGIAILVLSFGAIRGWFTPKTTTVPQLLTEVSDMNVSPDALTTLSMETVVPTEVALKVEDVYTEGDNEYANPLYIQMTDGTRQLVSDSVSFFQVTRDCSRIHYQKSFDSNQDGIINFLDEYNNYLYTVDTKIAIEWPYDYYDSSFSPDSEHYVFWDNYDLYVNTFDNDNLQRLTYNSGWGMHEKWSPNGEYIALYTTDSYGTCVSVVKADGTNLTHLACDLGNGWGLSWTSDNRVVFSKEISTDVRHEFTIKTDGTELTDVTNTEITKQNLQKCGWPDSSLFMEAW